MTFPPIHHPPTPRRPRHDADLVHRQNAGELLAVALMDRRRLGARP